MAESERCRLDTYLVRQGYAGGREKAKELIATGQVTVNGRPVTKPSAAVTEKDTVVCTAAAPRYVGRGGYKLEKVLPYLSVENAVCMDVGASTGGFTDCLIQNGAARVYAVDVGHGQLHPSLRENERVIVLEGTDIRDAALTDFVQPATVSLATVDVSFVSLNKILPSLLPYLSADATVVLLIKPQFEAGRTGIGKNGVVKDRKTHIRVLHSVLSLFASLSLTVSVLTYSPITGGEGNIEYLCVLHTTGVGEMPSPETVVAQAFAALRK